MTKNIFIYYIVVSSSIAIYAAATKSIQVAFGYEFEFDNIEMFYYLRYIASALVFFILGYYFNRVHVNWQKPNSTIPLLKIARDIRYILAACLQVSVIFYISLKISQGIDQSAVNAYVNFRPLGGKLTIFILFVQALIPVLSPSKSIIQKVSILFCFLLSFIFAWVDASRAALVPLAGIMFFSMISKKYITCTLIALYMMYLFMISIVARGINDRINLNALSEILNLTLENFNHTLIISITYFSAFSILHFFYVVKNEAGHFALNDLMYSALPIPSVLWPEAADYFLWRVDIIRPMGAASEVLRVSLIAFFIFFFILGQISKRVDSLSNPHFRLLSICIFSVIVVMIFQYNLRTCMWLLYLLIGIYFLDLILSNYHKKRTVVSKENHDG